jgi:diketogulonate reductase-like aldo/keto reductase
VIHKMKTLRLPNGQHVAALGQGTWELAESSAKRAEEIATLRLGLDLGATLIDTAEMYGDGKVEELVGEAIAGRRDEVFLVSKVYPHNASRRGALDACARSLRRLRTDRIDLYLLHWRGEVSLVETLEAFMDLQRQGKIRHYGVSNLKLSDLQEWWALDGGSNVATNQVLYNLAHRGIEWDLLPWVRERQLPVMAYSPIDQGRLARDPKLIRFARRHGLTPVQTALAWLLAADDIMVIPKTSHRERLKENLGALDRPLTKQQLAELDQLFPPPSGARSLEMI